MNDNFTDRLLDASLRQYSQVTPPEGFAVRPRPQRRPSLWWLSLPAMAAAASVAAFVWMPRPDVALPQRYVAFHVLVPVAHTVRAHSRPVPQYRVLSAVEIASLNELPQLVAPHEEKSLADLEISDLEVKPLENANPNPKE